MVRLRHGRAWYARFVRFLGVDYGRKRIGLALSDATGLLARPWKTIAARRGARSIADDIMREVETLRADADGLDGVVVGLPRRLSGDANDLTSIAEAVASELRSRHLAVTLQDERLTSREAEELLARREKDWRKRKPLIDAMAASIILQDFLDARGAGVARSSAADAGDAEMDGDEQQA
jgi:putative Holliday junction resolvase